MSPLDRLALPPTVDLPSGDLRRAAVAIVAGPRDELLLIRRADRPGDHWSGHMAFPGGRAEAHDASLLDTARRETREEIGLDLGAARVLGVLPTQLTPTIGDLPRMVVVPYLFRVDDWPPLTPNHEVQSVHAIALSRFLEREGRSTFPYTWRGTTWDLPCVDLDRQRVWGMTLRMIDDLVAAL